ASEPQHESRQEARKKECRRTERTGDRKAISALRKAPVGIVACGAELLAAGLQTKAQVLVSQTVARKHPNGTSAGRAEINVPAGIVECAYGSRAMRDPAL